MKFLISSNDLNRLASMKHSGGGDTSINPIRAIVNRNTSSADTVPDLLAHMPWLIGVVLIAKRKAVVRHYRCFSTTIYFNSRHSLSPFKYLESPIVILAIVID